jgi:hypothetical protein
MIVLISKRLPPTRCGIGDYTRNLAETLAQRGAKVAGLAWEPSAGTPPSDPAFPITYLPAPTGKNLSTVLAQIAAKSGEPLDVILQTSQYDVHPRGLAGWLVEGLAASLAHGHIRKWVVMMHEIWLPQLARRRDLWIYPWQRHSFTRLLGSAAALAVTTTTYARRIEHLVPSAHPTVLPVFSNFEEPASETALNSRRTGGAWAVFGSTLRLRTGLPSLLENTRTQPLRSSIKSLEVFGGDKDLSVSACLARHADVPQRYQPAISAAAAGECLRACHAAWIDYEESALDPALLGKSTLLATALANGTLPVLAHPATGFTANGEPVPFWYSPENPPPAVNTPAAATARAANLAWYHRHSARAVHAHWYEGALLAR